MVLEGVGFLSREGKLEEVPGLKSCMERSFLSQHEKDAGRPVEQASTHVQRVP